MNHLITKSNKMVVVSDKEIKLKKDEAVISRIDIDGNILYYNNSFIKISGYKKNELLYMPYSVLKHPDMPKAVFIIIWKTLLAGRPTYAVVKNMTKNGDYYWLLIKYSVQKDNHNNIVSFLLEGKQALEHVIKEVKPLYRDLLKKEKYSTVDESVKHLNTFLNSNNYALYNDYICKIVKKKKIGFFSI